jgi:hypothetical protein
MSKPWSSAPSRALGSDGAERARPTAARNARVPQRFNFCVTPKPGVSPNWHRFCEIVELYRILRDGAGSSPISTCPSPRTWPNRTSG